MPARRTNKQKQNLVQKEGKARMSKERKLQLIKVKNVNVRTSIYVIIYVISLAIYHLTAHYLTIVF